MSTLQLFFFPRSLPAQPRLLQIVSNLLLICFVKLRKKSDCAMTTWCDVRTNSVKDVNSTRGRWQTFLPSSSSSITHILSLLPTPASTSSLHHSVCNSISDTSHPPSLYRFPCCTNLQRRIQSNSIISIILDLSLMICGFNLVCRVVIHVIFVFCGFMKW